MISYLYSFNPRVDISENSKYFTAALIYNNIESRYPPMNSSHKSKGVR